MRTAKRRVGPTGRPSVPAATGRATVLPATTAKPGLPTRTSAAALLLAALGPALLGACAWGGTGFRPPGEASAGYEEIEILVRNANFNQVTVYTVRSGAQRRLGIVAGKDEAVFKTDWNYPDLQLRVKFLAGPDYFTETLPVSPGERLELTIPARSQSAS